MKQSRSVLRLDGNNILFGLVVSSEEGFPEPPTLLLTCLLEKSHTARFFFSRASTCVQRIDRPSCAEKGASRVLKQGLNPHVDVSNLHEALECKGEKHFSLRSGPCWVLLDPEQTVKQTGYFYSALMMDCQIHCPLLKPVVAIFSPVSVSCLGLAKPSTYAILSRSAIANLTWTTFNSQRLGAGKLD